MTTIDEAQKLIRDMQAEVSKLNDTAARWKAHAEHDAKELVELRALLAPTAEGALRLIEQLTKERAEKLSDGFVLATALKYALARLARVDGGDSMTVTNGLDALASVGYDFDLDGFIKAEDDAALAAMQVKG